ncbi:MAG: hypothetical protein OXE52_08920 [Chloroflexi bacterium]|nr:hypothetical protein [Chloroflexota bacterium]
MEKNRIERFRSSTGDGSSYYRETSAVNDLASTKSSAAMGNLADVMKNGLVTFPNILAPDSFRLIPLGKTTISESNKADGR